MLRTRTKYLIGVFCSLSLITFNAEAQQFFETSVVDDSFYFSTSKEFKLKSDFLAETILSCFLNGVELNSNQFSFTSEDQFVRLKISIDTSITNLLVLKYVVVPIKVGETFRKNVLKIQYDSTRVNQIKIIEKKTPVFSSRDFFGTQLEKSGTLIRGFTVGSNKDLTLKSGLRLQMAGKLSDELEIVAALTDENSPIQPEGNTQTIQEFDKVFIELRHKQAQGTFGDFQIESKLGEFGIINRKLQGLKTHASFGDELDLTAAYASSRGKFNTMNFFGVDGVQGPYRLTGSSGEREIIVLAGTEKVFFNGEPLIRGENYDYTIDYSTGEITFTPRKIITAASRISVDYEYTDRKFQRNFFGTTTSSSLFGNKLKIGASYFREGDDETSPIDISLSEDDKRILSESGNDRLKASKSGIVFVGYDSLGKPLGVYVQVDTIINNEVKKIFYYSPGDSNAVYNVNFSFVGINKGDYDKIGLGRFKFVGINRGSYLPIVFLPMPELNQVGNVFLEATLIEHLSTAFEFSLSSKDKNRFSSLDDNQNLGSAYRFKVGLDSINLNLFNIELGKFGINYYERFVQQKYNPINRIFEVEYNRNWNIDSTLSIQNERLRELKVDLKKQKAFFITVGYGTLKRGDFFSTNRISTNFSSEMIENLKLDYSFKNLSTKNIRLNSDWNKHIANVIYDYDGWIPSLRIESEIKKDKLSSMDSLIISSFSFFDVIGRLTYNNIKWLSLNSEYNFRSESKPLNGKLLNESLSNIFQLIAATKQLSNLNSTLTIAYRMKKYKKEFQNLSGLDNNSLLIRFFGRGNFFNRSTNLELYYETSSQRSAKLERIFLRVPKGTGSYIYKGDLNNNGVAEEFEFELAKFDGDYILTTIPSDELYPVTDVKASSRLKFDFERFEIGGIFGSILSSISTETYLRVEENSRDPISKNVYLLSFRTFQNPTTTIKGSNIIQQDVYLFQNSSEFNTLFRFIEKRSFNKFALNEERRFQQEKSIRIRSRFVKEISNQTEYISITDNLHSSESNYRNHRIRSNSLNTKFSYFPYKNVEVGMKFEVSKGYDYFPTKFTELDVNTQQLSVIISISDLSRLNFEIERSELVVNVPENPLPFELSKGNVEGKNFFWRVNFDYRFSTNLQFSGSYDGRLRGSSNAVHTARAELRAFF